MTGRPDPVTAYGAELDRFAAAVAPLEAEYWSTDERGCLSSERAADLRGRIAAAIDEHEDTLRALLEAPASRKFRRVLKAMIKTRITALRVKLRERERWEKTSLTFNEVQEEFVLAELNDLLETTP